MISKMFEAEQTRALGRQLGDDSLRSLRVRVSRQVNAITDPNRQFGADDE